jgi:hypothetical protein
MPEVFNASSACTEKPYEIVIFPLRIVPQSSEPLTRTAIMDALRWAGTARKEAAE